MQNVVSLYAVIGNPIFHSLSPHIHAAFAEQTHQKNMVYMRILATMDDFDVKVQLFKKQGGKGLNITAPFKEKAYRLVDHCTERAETAKAVNTLRFEANGTMFGDNTDGAGFIQDVKKYTPGTFTQKKILCLGAGGAMRGLLPSILQQNPYGIVIANRTMAKAEILVEAFQNKQCPVVACSVSQLGETSFDWIIHGIGQNAKIDYASLPFLNLQHTWCYDLSYGTSSPFLMWAKEKGATHLLDGLGLLVEQAALSFYFWRGIKPEIETILKRLKEHYPNGA